jgi:hypothetical protein
MKEHTVNTLYDTLIRKEDTADILYDTMIRKEKSKMFFITTSLKVWPYLLASHSCKNYD